eukprot:11701132-Alexandrium_andersonii.AAC.1
MSASLVGSEMCIRDRRCVSAATSDFQDTVEVAGMCPVRPCRRERSICPVSYTHLTLPTICSV